MPDDTVKTTIWSLGYQLTGRTRADDSTYFTCASLPGFHFIVAPGEHPEETMRPALSQFIGLYRKARAANGD